MAARPLWPLLGDHRHALPARHVEVEQDRTPAVLVHLRKMVWPAPHRHAHHRGLDRCHDHPDRPRCAPLPREASRPASQGRGCGERASGRRDFRVVVAPAATTGRATPALLAPHQPGRAPEHRQVDELDLADPVSMHDTDHGHVGQPDQQRAHSRSIGFQAGAPRNSTTSNIAETRRAPMARPGSTPNHHPTLKREEPQIRSVSANHGTFSGPFRQLPASAATPVWDSLDRALRTLDFRIRL